MGEIHRVFAIGHSNYSLRRFMELLNNYNINCVVDIRGIPYSAYNSQYNRENLQDYLRKHGVVYIYMGQEFGANRITRISYLDEGYADFEKVVKERKFLRGVERLRDGYNRGYEIVLLGAMQDTIRCHRSILVGRFLYGHGFVIKYIQDDGSCIGQDEVEQRLLETYFPNRRQLTLEQLLGKGLRDEELVNLGYQKANREIGYRVERLEKE